MNPLQKARVIRTLRARGHTVGFLGDGINDAVAMRDADVAISVDTAVDIAKESADIILLEKSLMVLEEGVIQGRVVFGNIVKYIKMTTSSNFGNVFSVLVASAFIPFLPMAALQPMIQNLLYDLSELSLPWDNMDKEFVDRRNGMHLTSGDSWSLSGQSARFSTSPLSVSYGSRARRDLAVSIYAYRTLLSAPMAICCRNARAVALSGPATRLCM